MQQLNVKGAARGWWLLYWTAQEVLLDRCGLVSCCTLYWSAGSEEAAELRKRTLSPQDAHSQVGETAHHTQVGELVEDGSRYWAAGTHLELLGGWELSWSQPRKQERVSKNSQ